MKSTIAILMGATAALTVAGRVGASNDGGAAVMRRHHAKIFGRDPHHLEKRAFSGMATWYDVTTGAGACGDTMSPDEHVVALNQPMFGNLNAVSSYCGKTITISAGGKSTTARITDACPESAQTCHYGSLDMSKGLFQYFNDLGVGTFPITWTLGSGGGSSSNSNSQSSKSNNDNSNNNNDDAAAAKKAAQQAKQAAAKAAASAEAAASSSSAAAAAAASSKSAEAAASRSSAAAYASSTSAAAAASKSSEAAASSASVASKSRAHASATKAAAKASASEARAASKSAASVASASAAKASASAAAEAAKPKNLQAFSELQLGLKNLVMAAQE